MVLYKVIFLILWYDSMDDFKNLSKESVWKKLLFKVEIIAWSEKVKIEGAKNAVLPLLAATVLASEGQSVLKKCSGLV